MAERGVTPKVKLKSANFRYSVNKNQVQRSRSRAGSIPKAFANSESKLGKKRKRTRGVFGRPS